MTIHTHRWDCLDPYDCYHASNPYAGFDAWFDTLEEAQAWETTAGRPTYIEHTSSKAWMLGSYANQPTRWFVVEVIGPVLRITDGRKRNVVPTCWICKHLIFHGGQDDWSEETPGWAAYITCACNHEMPQFDEDDAKMKCLAIAAECPDFTPEIPKE